MQYRETYRLVVRRHAAVLPRETHLVGDGRVLLQTEDRYRRCGIHHTRITAAEFGKQVIRRISKTRLVDALVDPVGRHVYRHILKVRTDGYIVVRKTERTAFGTAQVAALTPALAGLRCAVLIRLNTIDIRRDRQITVARRCRPGQHRLLVVLTEICRDSVRDRYDRKSIGHIVRTNTAVEPVIRVLESVGTGYLVVNAFGVADTVGKRSVLFDLLRGRCLVGLVQLYGLAVLLVERIAHVESGLTHTDGTVLAVDVVR